MAISARITETTPAADCFTAPLTTIVSLFAAVFPTDDRGDGDTTKKNRRPGRFPPASEERPSRTESVPGEPVDTSLAPPPAVSDVSAPEQEQHATLNADHGRRKWWKHR